MATDHTCTPRRPATRTVLPLAMLAAMLGTVVATAAAAETSAANNGRRAAPAPKIPADAHAVVDRLAMCTHFMGEFDGDGSERDREVNATLTELRCERIDADVAAIRKKYPRDATVQAALKDATAL